MVKKTFLQKTKQYLFNVAIWLDQGLNTFRGGCPDETVSSRIGRIKEASGGVLSWKHPFEKLLDPVLEFLQKGHSIYAIEHDKLKQIREEDIIDGNIGTEITTIKKGE